MEWYLSVLRIFPLWVKLIYLPETYMTAQFDKLALIFVALSNLTGGRKLWSTRVTKYVSSNDLQKVQPT